MAHDETSDEPLVRHLSFVEHGHLLPPPEGACQQCGREHAPGEPHDAASLHYQYWFRRQRGRWPTWADAMAHCAAEVQDVWRQSLSALGVADDQLVPTGTKGTKMPDSEADRGAEGETIESTCPMCGAVERRRPYDIGSGPELSCAQCEWCWGAEGQALKPIDMEQVARSMAALAAHQEGREVTLNYATGEWTIEGEGEG